jgi:hypothetical protein
MTSTRPNPIQTTDAGIKRFYRLAGIISTAQVGPNRFTRT